MKNNVPQQFPLGALFCALIGFHTLTAAATEASKLPLTTAAAAATTTAAPKPAPTPQATSSHPQSADYAGPTEVAPPLKLTAGKSALVRLPAEANRISIGNPDVADVMLINPREVYLLGKKVGTTNVFVWTRSGRTTIMDVAVSVDTATLKTKLDELVPGQAGVKIDSLADSVVLSGRVSDALKVNRMVSLAEVYSGGKRVVNLLNVDGSQQVMLEVKVAEVSKTLLDKLGVQFDATRSVGDTGIRLLTRLLTGSAGSLAVSRPGGSTEITLDAEIRNGLVKVLAEPTITAISGQEGAFLAGGRIFIPVPQSGSLGGTTITLEEKEFGVGLRFTPTVLEEGRINLRVVPEVSELSQVGTTVTALGSTNVLPTITTRRASTTVQLADGETFAIGGLIRNNVTEAIKAFPFLGELPIIGPLFRSAEFQTDRSELLFIVTPRLVKPMQGNVQLPTDSFIEPTRREFFLGGRLEGQPQPPEPPATTPANPEPGGFKLK